MEFYRSVFGGALEVTTFGDFPMPGIGAEEADKVMHSKLTAPGELILMASDTPESMPLTEGGTITISLGGEDDAELRGYWDKLTDGATIGMPLEVAPWGDAFGQLTDKFGIAWMVNIAGSAATT